MKILFSPSETKTSLQTQNPLNSDSLLFPTLFEQRCYVINLYHSLLKNYSHAQLEYLFGIKDPSKIETLSHLNLFDAFTCKAIQRYSGTAYHALHFESLEPKAQHFIENNVIIFSNLFGPILAGDLIPEYKLHQGASLEDLKTEYFYKEHFSSTLDAFLKDNIIVDLRAGYYEKFYTLKQPYLTMKFLKDGKSISHFAKAYRGKVLREIAIHEPKSMNDLEHIVFDGLEICDIKEQKFKREYLFKIID